MAGKLCSTICHPDHVGGREFLGRVAKAKAVSDLLCRANRLPNRDLFPPMDRFAIWLPSRRNSSGSCLWVPYLFCRHHIYRIVSSMRRQIKLFREQYCRCGHRWARAECFVFDWTESPALVGGSVLPASRHLLPGQGRIGTAEGHICSSPIERVDAFAWRLRCAGLITSDDNKSHKTNLG